MKHERERSGHGTSARASAPVFPPSDGVPGEVPSSADTSHVARRVASAPAHEVDLDEIQLFDDAPAPFPELLTVPPHSSRPPPLPSLVPAIPSQAPFDLPLTSIVPPKRRSRGAQAGVLVACVAAIALAAADLAIRSQGHGGTAPVVAAPAPIEPSATAATVAPLVAPPAVEVSAPAATAEPTKAPPATTGIVTGSEGHRLWIDGTLAAGWQETIACGSHLVQVGSAGTPRTVDVPCGGDITVSP